MNNPNKNKKILITGAGGFIGSHLVEHLLSEGVKPQNLRLLIANNEKMNNLPKMKFEIVRGDIRDIKIVKKIVKNVNVIYHLAALTMDKSYTDKDYYETNFGGVKNLINSIKNVKLKKFVFFSSVAVFGLPSCKGDIINFSENTKKNPCEVYGNSKLEAENLIIEASKQWGLKYSIIRPTTVYGPRDRQSFPTLIKAIKSHMFLIIGNGKNKLDYVNVKDLVRGARLAEMSTKNGDYILGGGPLSLNEIVESIISATNSWIIPVHIPKKIAYIISYITNFFGLPLYPDRVNAMTSNFYFNISKAKKEIGYVPQINLYEGVKLINE